jgi:hypothetical protein
VQVGVVDKRAGPRCITKAINLNAETITKGLGTKRSAQRQKKTDNSHTFLDITGRGVLSLLPV